MEFAEIIKKRRMCREFFDRDVEEDQLNAILDAAVRFPSAGHTQPQEFIVVRGEKMKTALAKAALSQMFVAQAPVLVVVVSDTRRSGGRYGRRGVEFYSIIDGAFAAMLILLAAIDQGLGAVFVGAFEDEEVRRVLGLPQHVRPIGIIPIGYCSEEPVPYSRRRRRDIIHAEHW